MATHVSVIIFLTNVRKINHHAFKEKRGLENNRSPIKVWFILILNCVVCDQYLRVQQMNNSSANSLKFGLY